MIRLEDRPQSTALSYVRGNSDVTETIKINSGLVPITMSLADALYHIRAASAGSILDAFWVDAVCIDQDETTLVCSARTLPTGAPLFSFTGRDLNRWPENLETFLQKLKGCKRRYPDNLPRQVSKPFFGSRTTMEHLR